MHGDDGLLLIGKAVAPTHSDREGGAVQVQTQMRNTLFQPLCPAVTYSTSGPRGPDASGLSEVRAVSYLMGRGLGSLIFL